METCIRDMPVMNYHEFISKMKKVIKCYSLDEKSKSYYVNLTDGKIIEEELQIELLQ